MYRQHKCIDFITINDDNCPSLLAHEVQILIAVHYLPHDIDNMLVHRMRRRHYMVFTAVKFLPTIIRQVSHFKILITSNNNRQAKQRLYCVAKKTLSCNLKYILQLLDGPQTRFASLLQFI